MVITVIKAYQSLVLFFRTFISKMMLKVFEFNKIMFPWSQKIEKIQYFIIITVIKAY